MKRAGFASQQTETRENGNALAHTRNFLTTQLLDGNILCGYCNIFTLKQENDEKGILSHSLHSRMSDHAGLMRQEVARYDASAYSL